MRGENTLGVVSREWRRARKQLVSHAAKRIKISAMIDIRITRDLFRRHICRASQ